jgi:hypothetical protein
LGVISGVIIIIYSLFSPFKVRQQPGNQQLLVDWLWIYGIYLLFTTTLHPWYVIPILVFSIFTTYRFAVLWSFLVFLTYSGYTTSGYTENLWVVGVEYLSILLYLGYELWKYNAPGPSLPSIK